MRCLFVITCVVFVCGFRSASAAEERIGQEIKSLAPEDALVLAYDCLAAVALLRHDDSEALLRARTSANKLIALLSADQNGRFGWPYVQRLTEKASRCGNPGSIDPFGDGTCNPPNTPYMLQTGYAVACLAQISILTKDEDYLRVAVQAVADSWQLGAAPAGCADCFYYWYSYHSNDRFRFVRNTNLAMGLGLTWLYAATEDLSYRKRALAIARTERFELASGNHGYFGVDDLRYQRAPLAESERIENHVVHQIHALMNISRILDDPDAMINAQQLLDSFLNCTNRRCQSGGCASWAAPVACKATATIAPCALADTFPQYQHRCNEVLKALPKLNSFQTFLTYGPRDSSDLFLWNH